MSMLDEMRIRAQVAALGGAGRGGGTRRVAEARAAVSGKSVRAEMRAVQRALKTGREPARQAPATARAGASEAARTALGSAQRVYAGQVKVRYSSGKKGGTSEGTRNIGWLTVDAKLAAKLTEVQDALAGGEEAAAESLLSEGILDRYGSLGGTLDITEYTGGFEIE